MKSEDKIFKLIFAAQKEERSSEQKPNMIILLEKFRPLILKYRYRLHSDDAENDLVLFFIEMIKSIQLEGFKSSNSDYQLLAFISKAMHNEFIRLSKAKNKEFQILELDEWYYEELTYNEYDKLEIVELLNHLRIRERQIIILKYWFGYSDIEVGSRMNVTRQTVNRIVNSSLETLRRYV